MSSLLSDLIAAIPQNIHKYPNCSELKCQRQNVESTDHFVRVKKKWGQARRLKERNTEGENGKGRMLQEERSFRQCVEKQKTEE